MSKCDTCILALWCNDHRNTELNCPMTDTDGIRTATEARRAGVREGVNAVLEYIGAMNMHDEISNEAYKKITIYFGE